MRTMRALVPLAVGLPALAFAVGVAGPPVKLHGLAKEAFDELPPDAALDIGGRIETKAQLLAKLHPAASAKLAMASLLDEATAQVEREDKAKVDQVNASVLARVRPGPPPGPRLRPAEPRITEVPYPTGPGYLVLVFGSGFGARPGELRIHFENGGIDLPLAVGVLLPHSVASQLKSDRAWADDQIVAYVQPQLGGVVDQTAHLVVVTSDGKRSAPAPIHFTPARQIRLLPASLKQLIPDEGDCNRPGRHSVGCESAVSNFFIWHVGADEIRPDPRPLKNGWQRHMTSYKGGIWGAMPGCQGFVGASKETPSFDGPLAVSWMAECYVDFSVSYVVVGPRGTDPQ